MAANYTFSELKSVSRQFSHLHSCLNQANWSSFPFLINFFVVQSSCFRWNEEILLHYLPLLIEGFLIVWVALQLIDKTKLKANLIPHSDSLQNIDFMQQSVSHQQLIKIYFSQFALEQLNVKKSLLHKYLIDS